MLIGSQKKPSLCLIQTKVGEVDKTAILRRLALFPGPCSGPSCIVVKNPAGYISFCLNILYLNLMIQEAIVTWPVQTVWFRNDTIFKPVCSDYCWILIFFIFIFHQRRESLCHWYSAENWRFRASILRFVSLNKTDYHKAFNYQPHFLGTATEPYCIFI